jgi:hypothetical protein
LHAILFGPKTTSTRMKRMVTVALDEQSKTPALMCVPSSFHEALDSVSRVSRFKSTIGSIHVLQVQLSQTFLGIAESLRKSGALMQ